MTPAQIQQVKKQIREIAKAADRWRPLVAKWRDAAERGDAALPAAVREKLAQDFQRGRDARLGTGDCGSRSALSGSSGRIITCSWR